MSKIRKALMAAVTAAFAAGATALPDGITVQEWATIAIAAVVAGYAVWQVPNAPASTPARLPTS
jgi:hypothetical protein